jgi:hypothetical protein
MRLLETVIKKIGPASPYMAALLLGIACMGLLSQIVQTLRGPAPPAAAQSLQAVPAAARDHAEAAADSHLFGAAATEEAAVPTDPESSPYKISGIICEGDADRCKDPQTAVASLTGPGGDITVQIGTRLPTGERVSNIEPYAVTLSQAGGEVRLTLDMPKASTDEITATLPLDGSVHVATRAAPSAPQAALVANMQALQVRLQAAQARRRALERKPTPP